MAPAFARPLRAARLARARSVAERACGGPASRAVRRRAAARELRRARGGCARRNALSPGFRLRRRQRQPLPAPRLRAARRLAERDPGTRPAQRLPAFRRRARRRRNPRPGEEPPDTGIHLPRVLRRPGPALGLARACRSARQAPAEGPPPRPPVRRRRAALRALARRAALGQA